MQPFSRATLDRVLVFARRQRPLLSLGSLAIYTLALACEVPVIFARVLLAALAGIVLVELEGHPGGHLGLVRLAFIPTLWSVLALVTPVGSAWWWRTRAGGRDPSTREQGVYQDALDLLQAHATQPLPLPARWFVLDTPQPDAAVCGNALMLSRGLVGIDCFYVGRLKGTEGAIWQLTAIDVRSSYAWAELVICKQGNPTGRQTSKLAQRVARELKAAGWQLDRVLSDNGNEFRSNDFTSTLEKLNARHTRIHAGRPQTNGHVEALHKTILDECWRPAFARYIYPRYTGLKRELDTYLRYYNTDRVHHGRLTRGRIPADIVSGAQKMEAR